MIDRRQFLKFTAVGGAIAAAGCTPDNAERTDVSQSAASAPFELEEVTLAQLQEGMRSGRFTARSITRLYLKRIEDLDKKGPALHSIMETNPDALAIADALDAEFKSKGPRSPLHGIALNIAKHPLIAQTGWFSD